MIRPVPWEGNEAKGGELRAAHLALWDDSSPSLYRHSVQTDYLPHVRRLIGTLAETSIGTLGGSIHFDDVALWSNHERLFSLVFVELGLPPYVNGVQLLEFDAESAPDALDLLLIAILDDQDVSLLSFDRRFSLQMNHDSLLE